MATSPEALLISSVLRDGDMDNAIRNGVSANMFHAFADEWGFLESFFAKHRKAPTKIAFRNKFPEFRIKACNDTGHFAEEVRSSHARRELRVAMQEGAEFLGAGNLEQALATMQTSVVKVAANMGMGDDSDILRSYEDIMGDIDARRERYAERGAAGVPSGFASLDERTGGFQPGELWIVGARLGEGKSWTMQRMAAAAVMGGYKVQFNALEQSRSQVAMRIYSMLSGSIGASLFDSTSLMQGKDYDPVMFRKFVRTLKEQVKGALHVSDATRGRVSALTIASQIERNQPDIVFVDYITLLAKQSPDWQGVAQLSSDLVNLSVQYGIPIVAASQLNREAGISKRGEPAGPEALAQADAIGQDATGIINLAKLSDHALVAKVVKARNAPGGFKWYMDFDPGAGRFEEVSFDKAQQIADNDADQRDAESIRKPRIK